MQKYEIVYKIICIFWCNLFLFLLLCVCTHLQVYSMCVCVCVPYLSVCAMPTPSLTQSVCGSECASPFYTLAPMGEGLWGEKQTC